MSQKVTKDMTFHQVMQMDSRVLEVFSKYNLGCVGCMGAANETIEMGAMAHGLDVDKLLTDLNTAIAD